MIRLRFYILLILVMMIGSCTLVDNEKPGVFYISLSDTKVKLPFSHGDDTHKIREIWAFADGQIVGIFPLPAKVPMIFTGKETEITILAGIRNNGMLDQPAFYPFYKSINKIVKGEIGQIINIPLDFSYVETAKFPVNESFETNHCFTTDLDGKTKPEWAITSSTATTGSRSGMVTLTPTDNIFEMACTNLIRKGENAKGKSYLELDYKGQGEIAVGLLKINSGLPKITYHLFIPANDNWNKIYVELTDQTSANDYSEYGVVMSIRKTGNNPESKVYLDNIKHIHF
ncbi:MAG: hypothetical protein IPK35_15010 [Saprospiraceae bacterium]|jgi:hypothetical protein|nr:hypothetical protein [Saprospiraceae bacterium]